MNYCTGTTNNKNGPFQFIKSTHTKKAIKDNCRIRDISHSKTIFTEEEVSKIIKNKNYQVKTIELNGGDAVFVNTRCLHRGKPAEKGGRLALTSYSYLKIPKHIKKLVNGN